MIDAIRLTQAAMNADMLKIEAMSRNIANMKTPGYHREVIETMSAAIPAQTDRQHIRETVQSFRIRSAGPTEATGNPMHLALTGEGYFVLRTDAGLRYTRRGDFQPDAEGFLADTSGARLEGLQGAIPVRESAFHTDRQGRVFLDNTLHDTLRIVRFHHPEQLQETGNGLYATPEAPDLAEASVLQGQLERSNVRSLDEMLTMLRLSRHFESSGRILQTINHLLTSAVNQLGASNV